MCDNRTLSYLAEERKRKKVEMMGVGRGGGGEGILRRTLLLPLFLLAWSSCQTSARVAELRDALVSRRRAADRKVRSRRLEENKSRSSNSAEKCKATRQMLDGRFINLIRSLRYLDLFIITTDPKSIRMSASHGAIG